MVNAQKYRPVMGGCSIGHYQTTAGSMGCVVYDNQTGTKLILSNSHVLALANMVQDSPAQEGDYILQPAAYDGGMIQNDYIGTLHKWVILDKNAPNYVDAAVALPNNDGEISDSIIQIGQINGVINPELGLTVQKYGRTTEYTKGTITKTNLSLYIAYGDPADPNTPVLLFRDCFMITQIAPYPKMIDGGDSGSLILDESNNAVGLVFAANQYGEGIAMPISSVLNALDVNINGIVPPPQIVEDGGETTPSIGKFLISVLPFLALPLMTYVLPAEPEKRRFKY